MDQAGRDALLRKMLPVSVPRTLRGAHPAVLKYRRRLRDDAARKPRAPSFVQRGFAAGYIESPFSSDELTHRALRVMSALFYAYDRAARNRALCEDGGELVRLVLSLMFPRSEETSDT